MATNADLIDRIPQEVIDFMLNFKLTEIVDLPQVPQLSFEDTLILVTGQKVTMKANFDQFMQFLNENLRNFIMWKPKIIDNAVHWERSSSDEAPEVIRFEDIMFPMADNDHVGMITSDFYKKVMAIDNDNIVYKDLLTSELAKKAEKIHVHNQYQLISEMPTKLSQFENDTKYIVFEQVPTKVSAFENDKNYVRFVDIPDVSTSTRGLMTTTMLNTLISIQNDYVGQEQLKTVVKDVSDSLPTKISAFDNDIGYLEEKNLISSLAEIGSINLLKNSEFRMFNAGGILNEWEPVLCTLNSYRGDPDYPYCGIAAFQAGGSLKGKLAYSLGTDHMVTFYAKSNRPSKFTVSLGDASKEIVVLLSWSKYTMNLKNGGTNPSNDLIITFNGYEEPSDDPSTETVELTLTQIKVERGRLATEYYPSFYDLQGMIGHRATTDEFGIVKPDNYSLGFDANGYLCILNNPEVVGVHIDDENVSLYTTYSSKMSEERLSTKAPIVDGKIPEQYIPVAFEDVINGKMILNGSDMVFAIDPGQYTRGDPRPSVLYVDTESNLAYRWTGSTYIACTTDRLGGSVLVKYNKTENCMYFVFPDSDSGS